MANGSKPPLFAELLLPGKPDARLCGQVIVSSLRHASANVQACAPQEAHSQQSATRNLASDPPAYQSTPLGYIHNSYSVYMNTATRFLCFQPPTAMLCWSTRFDRCRSPLKLLPVQSNQVLTAPLRQSDIHSIAPANTMLSRDHRRGIAQRNSHRHQFNGP